MAHTVGREDAVHNPRIGPRKENWVSVVRKQEYLTPPGNIGKVMAVNATVPRLILRTD